MILYHGSFLEIAKPDLVHSRPNVDFGRGFYVTPLYEQAAKWCGKFKHRGKDGIISLYEYDESKMAKVREKLGGDYNKIYKRMLDEDGRINSEYTGRAIHQGFLDDIEDKAFEQAVENKKYFDSAKNAITYNNRPGLGTDFIKDNNFEEVKIGDLVIPNGHDTKFLESDPNRSFGRNLLVDTGLSGNDRYVAISANNYSITGDDVNTDEVQKSLAKLQRASKTLEDGRKGINGCLLYTSDAADE